MKTKKITIGILAHVDAGKTTLSESLLYTTGSIRKMGRVDHQDAFLDTYQLEKARGITIFSKQAVFKTKNYEVTLLDTPGHVDFSAEMERTLGVLDYAILVINGADGIQGHTLTVWKLLRRYNVPVFIFVNKMDLISADKSQLMGEIQKRLDDKCIDFGNTSTDRFYDEIALCDEQLMEAYLEDGVVANGVIQDAIIRRHIFPVYYGSALKMDGIDTFITGLDSYFKEKNYPDILGARIYKISRDEQGNRLTHVKVTGGRLEVKSAVNDDKIDQIRLYSGNGYTLANEVSAGAICALTGLQTTKGGHGIGFEHNADAPVLTPVLDYKVLLPDTTNVYTMLKNLQQLEEEEPHLNVVWDEKHAEIKMQVMGEIQIEILKSTISERFGVEVDFGKGNLVYKETIHEPVVGVGHFEPLRHYAEVHLLLEPLHNGEGIEIITDCSEDDLARNYQRLVMSHLEERKHQGVLTNSELTDVKISLVAGKGHNKHTEGGDFREATFRALRNALMKAESILLEPYYNFTLEIPKDMIGRAMSDMERMGGSYDEPLINNEMAIMTGAAPVATIMHYSTEVIAYSKGLGRLALTFKGYEPCHNSDEIIELVGYDPVNDNDNPAGSVFCSHGSGFSVPWDKVDDYKHVDSDIKLTSESVKEVKKDMVIPEGSVYRNRVVDDKELEAIFNKTYGESKRKLPAGRGRLDSQSNNQPTSSKRHHNNKRALESEGEKYLLVDGYNVIFAWDELKDLASENLDLARLRLMDRLSNYQGQKGETVILVFDAYRVTGNRGSSFRYHNIYVVYTKEAETADQYIEKLVHEIRPKYEVTVATSDVLEQVIIMGKGAKRLSAEGLLLEVEALESQYKAQYMDEMKGERHRPFEKHLKKK